MIELTPAFKTAIANGGPLKYLIQISENDGVSWQDLPTGAEAHSPLGEVSGETEVEPFQFVGADCEITCNNINGYWTNSAKTGKLDTGLAIKFRLKEAPASIDNEWVQLIEGYIDLGSVTNYRTAFTCVFTVRGCLNVLDSVLANYVLADRPAQYPHKFGGWLEIVEVDPSYPEGLYELRFDASEGMISWDNGPGQSINTSSVLYLKGQTGNQISVRNMRSGADATALPQTSGKISQWIAVKVDPANVNNKKAYQPNTCMTLAQLKTAIYKYVDLNIDNVSSIPIKRPDANIINYKTQLLSSLFTRLQPIHVVGIDANRWIISFDGGGITGNYVLTVTNTPYFKIQSFVKFDPTHLGSNAIIVNSYRSTERLHLLVEETATRQNTYHHSITAWRLYIYELATMSLIGNAPGQYEIFYRSFTGREEVGFVGSIFYAAIKTNSATHDTDIYRILSDGVTTAYQRKTTKAFVVGCSLVPGVICLDQYYICAVGIPDTTDNKIKVYLQVWDIVNAVNYPNILTEIDGIYDPLSYWQMGPGQIAERNTVVEFNGLDVKTAGLFLLLSPINYNSLWINKLTSDKSELHEIIIDNSNHTLIQVSGQVTNPDPTHITTGRQQFYTDRITSNVVGMSIRWVDCYNPANEGQIRTINLQTNFTTSYSTLATLLGMSVVLPADIVRGDKYEIYSTTTGLTGATYNYDTIDKDVHFIRNSHKISGTTPLTSGMLITNEMAMSFDDLKTIYKNVPSGYPLAGDYNSDGTRILIATQDNLQIVDINPNTSPGQYPEVALADFEDKSLRDAVQESAISANCHLMPSEHNKRLSLIYKGKAANPRFTLLNTEYKEGPTDTPYFDYDAVEVNDKKAGVFSAGNKQRDISLTTQCTPDAYAQSLAYDILEHIGSGNRTHEAQAVGRVELEPGDEGYLELEDGTTKQVMILGHTTNPETLDRSMIIREF